MARTPNFTSRDVELTIADYESIQPIAHALSSDLRLKMLQLIGSRGLSVNEIARGLDIPVSTAAMNIQVLERAGILICENQPGAHGTLKICRRQVNHFSIDLAPPREQPVRRFEIPVGCYSQVEKLRPTCGLARREGRIGGDDDPAVFYDPAHFTASLLWIGGGQLIYNLPPAPWPAERMEYLSVSFEACAETFGFRNDYPSQIHVAINGQRLGQWHCPGDFGGRRGLMNPPWWNDGSTQFGQLKTWQVDHRGTLLDGRYISGVTLEDLNLDGGSCIALTIGADRGGMNLFGRHFGDYAQDIVVSYGASV